MATLTFEVPESVAVALGERELRDSDIVALMCDALNEVAREVGRIADRGDLNPVTIRALADRFERCADALVDVLPGHGRIAVLRQAMGLTVEEVAARVGVPVKTLKLWERDGLYGDEKDPAVPGLCDLFGVTVDHLLLAEAVA